MTKKMTRSGSLLSLSSDYVSLCRNTGCIGKDYTKHKFASCKREVCYCMEFSDRSAPLHCWQSILTWSESAFAFSSQPKMVNVRCKDALLEHWSFFTASFAFVYSIDLPPEATKQANCAGWLDRTSVGEDAVAFFNQISESQQPAASKAEKSIVTASTIPLLPGLILLAVDIQLALIFSAKSNQTLVQSQQILGQSLQAGNLYCVTSTLFLQSFSLAVTEFGCVYIWLHSEHGLHACALIILLF